MIFLRTRRLLCMKGNRLSILCVSALLFSGCSDSGKTSKAALARIEEERLVHEPLRAAPVLIRHLRDAVQVQDGVLIVEGDYDLHLLPLKSPWVVNCGLLGMSVVFGNSVGGDESARNDITVILTQASVEKTHCHTLVPAVGNEIKTVLTEH
jgi:hypothetical protein